VYYHINKYKKTQTSKNVARSGQLRKTTQKDDGYILREV